MCGIIGLFTPNDPERTWSPPALNAMTAALSHRGPDGSGTHTEPGLFFGHARLAVLDLSRAGHQPMRSPDGRFVITFNGEIYNFLALRAELAARGHSFTTRTDTEVLLAAWVVWGAAVLDRLEGIFAFAMWDRQERQLHLVRDHFGIKPLFYWQQDGVTAFASEPLAMFGPVIPPPEFAPRDLDQFFTFNYLTAPASGLSGVNQLPPAHRLEISATGTRLVRYWQLPCPETTPTMSADLSERYQELLGRAVRSQLVADAPLGLFLSGGLDSAAVALATHDAGVHPAAFTLGFSDAGFNELPAATRLADHLGLPKASTNLVWNQETIESTLLAMRELLADASCFPVWQLARFARRQVTVILAGDGGDEALAGYETYKAGRLTPWLRRIPAPLHRLLLVAARLLPADGQRYGKRLVIERLLNAAQAGPGRDHASFRRIFFDPLKARLYTPEFMQAITGYDPLLEYVAKIGEVPTNRSWLTGCQYADLHHFLPGVLAKVDRMSMANGLEVRVPLLDRELMAFCFALPDEAKRWHGQGKRILRQTLAGRIPDDHLRRAKAGFLPPVDAWFRREGAMAELFASHLDWARNHLPGWLRWTEVETAWHDHRQGRLLIGFALLGILQFINFGRHVQSLRLTPTRE
ncbi:MAG: asparagine synthase (glutamine-hydrolyzing) [Magnetococcales bacterium]|nr:asparagine synthase (glutamine-hydrolyzing) [Magnetococcales bacterium]